MTPAEVKALADQLVNDLRGTCLSIQECLIRHDHAESLAFEPAVTSVIDEEIFRCSVCDWWCDLDESNDPSGDGEYVCDDCI